MIDQEIRLLTSDEAIKMGLNEAVTNNSTKITASYTSNSLGFNFQPHNFVFIDKLGNLQAARFISEKEFLKFVEQYGRNQ